MRRDKLRTGSAPESADLSPLDEIERVDAAVEHAGRDEQQTMFDPGPHPQPPHPKEEGVTDRNGTRSVDMMSDTPPIDDVLGVELTEDELLDL
jgi:hypothetical protein